MKSIVGTLVVLLLAVPTAAQEASEIAVTRAEIQVARQEFVAKAMALTEDEALAFWPVYRDYRVEMARLGDRLVKVIQEFAASDAKLGDEQAKRLLGEYLDVEGDVVSVRKKYVGVFGKILPAPKVTRFFQIENKLDAIVRHDLAREIPLAR